MRRMSLKGMAGCACWHIDEAKLQPNNADAQIYPSWGGSTIRITSYAEYLILLPVIM